MATLLLIIIYLCFIGLGLPDSLLGTSWPEMYSELGVPISLEAIGNAIITIGTIISSMNASRLLKRFGTYRIVLYSTLLTALAIAGYGIAPNFISIILLGIPMGLGAGAIDTALNNYLALHYKASHMNWLHCFWGVGAMAGPTVISIFLKNNSSWRNGYYLVATLQFCIVLVILLSRPVWKSHKEKSQKEEEFIVMKFTELLRIKGVKFAMLIMLCYCATEYTIVCWGSTYLVKYRDVSTSTAAGWISIYYIGITAGRMLCGFIALKVKNRTLITAGLCTVLVGATLLLLPLPAFMASVGLAFIGFGCAPVFPGMISETPIRFGDKLSQSVISAELTAAYIGVLTFPMIFGFLASVISMSLIPYFIVGLVMIMLFSSRLLNETIARK